MTAPTADPGTDKVRAAYDRTHGEGAYDAADAATDWGGRHIYRSDEFLALEFAVPMWRIPGLIPAIGAGLILGAEKTGKSIFGLQLCLTVAAGLSFLDRPADQCPTLLVEEEGAPRSHQARISRQRSALGLAERADLPFYLAVREQVRLDDPEVVDWLRAEVRARGIQLMVIGPLSQVAALDDENQSSGVNALMRTINGLATELEIMILLVHHRRKDAVGAGVPNIRQFFASSRGSSALVAAVDVGLGLLREQEDAHGWLYVLHRDEASFKEHFDFDPRSLLVSSSPVPDRNVKAPPADVLQLIKSDAPIGISYVGRRLGVSYNTAKERIESLLDEGRIHQLPGKGNQKLYAPVPTDTSRMWAADDPVARPAEVAHHADAEETHAPLATAAAIPTGPDREEADMGS